MAQTVFAKILNIYAAWAFLFGKGFASHITIISEIAGDVKKDPITLSINP